VTLAAHVRVRLGALDLDVRVEVAPGETVALLGPNGAGKTTVLRAIAGLLEHDGSVVVDATPWDGWDPERRSVGIVFQEHRLFPHLDVLDNVAFGLRRRGQRRGAARAVAGEWLARLGLGNLGSDRPVQLSGGQQQRVALARALAVTPRVLLLDEPLAALDVTTRAHVRRALRAHLDEFDGMTIVVTHDPVDAMALADRVVIVEEGRVVQTGTALDVTSHPRSPFAAEVAGVNLFRGGASGVHVRVDDEFELVTGEPHEGGVFATFHPRAVSLHANRPEGSARNVWQGTVEDVDVRAGIVRVRLGVQGHGVVAEVTLGAYDELRLAQASTVWCALKATEVVVYPA
jgi:molybdate transport system ATP-binding protein